MPVVDLSLEGKVALITGGSKGIGLAIAVAFAEHGADIAIAARGAEALDSARKEIEATGRRAVAIQADASKDEDLESMYQRTVAELGGVDILINNAARGGMPSLGDTTHEMFHTVMQLNMWAPLRLSQLCRQSMVERGGGVIINIVSNEGVRPSLGIGIYAPSKAGLMNLSQLLAKEWVRDNIRVTCIAPGLHTDRAGHATWWKRWRPRGHYPSPQLRIGDPAEDSRDGPFPGESGGELRHRGDLRSGRRRDGLGRRRCHAPVVSASSFQRLIGPRSFTAGADNSKRKRRRS